MSFSADPTFSNYTNKQARAYAKNRGGYTDLLIQIIIDHHVKTGGDLRSVVDVGCGPGNSTRSLAVEFDHAIGLDPGVEMINAARDHGGQTRTSRPIKYIVSGAEAMVQSICKEFPLEKFTEGVDLITAAMAVWCSQMPTLAYRN